MYIKFSTNAHMPYTVRACYRQEKNERSDCHLRIDSLNIQACDFEVLLCSPKSS